MLESVIDSCKYVMDNAKYVTINYDKIDEIISSGEFNKVSYWLESNPFDLLDMGYRKVINFLLIYHTIGDYSFWGEPKWEIETEDGILDGSYAIMYILINWFKKDKSFDMSIEEFRDLLKGNVEIPLLKERYNLTVNLDDEDWVIKSFDHIAKERKIKPLRGETDYDRVIELLFAEIYSGAIGRVSWEKVECVND